MLLQSSSLAQFGDDVAESCILDDILEFDNAWGFHCFKA